MADAQQRLLMALDRQFPVSEWEREPHAGRPVRGNRNSNLYHLPAGCPGYHQISARNVVEFDDEQAALAAGFRKAGNCR